MILVYADDISGAAEIAGLGASAGFVTSLRLGGFPSRPEATRHPACHPERSEGSTLQVVSLDIRSLPPDKAEEVLREAAAAGTPDFVKTDSACRGHIKLSLDILGKGRNVVFVPQNPSMGRTVEGGIYRIGGVPISETVFAQDPEWPALTPDVSHLGIPDASSVEEIRKIVDAAPPGSLFAGAADLFRTFLNGPCHGLSTGGAQTSGEEPQRHTVITVFGSSINHGIPFRQMPQDLYEGKGDASRWTASLEEEYESTGRVAFGVGFERGSTPDGKERPRRLAVCIAGVLKSLAGRRSPDLVIIEGGATARACLEAMGLEEFRIPGSLAPGVVRLKPEGGGPEIILKPGSYPWPQELLEMTSNTI